MGNRSESRQMQSKLNIEKRDEHEFSRVHVQIYLEWIRFRLRNVFLRFASPLKGTKCIYMELVYSTEAGSGETFQTFNIGALNKHYKSYE